MTEEERIDWEEFQAMYKITKRINDMLYECDDADDFTRLNNIMRKFDPEKASSGRIISLMSTLRWGQHKTEGYPEFFEKCKLSLMKRPDYTNDLLLGLEP